MKQMPIVWKRLVKEGRTCTRCGETRAELEVALRELRAALAPMGIEPVLQEQVVDERAFKADPAQSNRVWIAGEPLEHWIDATSGMSRCCSVCGDSECRTLELAGRSYAAVPAELFVRAGLRAAAEWAAA